MQKNNISENGFEQCVKCTICTVYCPVASVLPLYPGPKAAGPDAERYRLKSGEFFDNNLKYCLNCKRCEVACPSGVGIADIILKARLEYGPKKVKLRDRILANTDFMGSLATPLAPVVNAATSLGVTKAAMDGILKIDRHRSFPKYASQKFTSWFKKYKQPDGLNKTVSFFHGCFVQYNYPQLGKDFVKVCNALGYRVELLPEEKCCGVALISNGLVEKATRNAKINLASIGSVAQKGQKTVSASSSCTYNMREEYSHILGLDAGAAADALDLASRFVYNAIVSEGLQLRFKSGFSMKAAYHTPCHLEGLGWGIYSVRLLRLIPGLELSTLAPNCCGIAGTYGFKKENYETSQKIGKALFDEIAEVKPQVVATDCETCRWQIEMSTSVPVMHPISILAAALED